MKNAAITCFVIAMLAAVFGLGVYLAPNLVDQPAPAYPVQLATNFDDVTLDDDLTVGDDASIAGDLAVTGNTTMAGTLALTGAATLSGDATIDDTISIDENAYALTGAQTITPTATYYQLAPVSVLTLTLSTASAADGDLIILHSTVSTATTIVDTGATVGGSVITLGENDLAVLIYGNSKWIEVASPDNS
jgi:hypothetical protein